MGLDRAIWGRGTPTPSPSQPPPKKMHRPRIRFGKRAQTFCDILEGHLKNGTNLSAQFDFGLLFTEFRFVSTQGPSLHTVI